MLGLLVALVVVAVAQTQARPSLSATTSTSERALPSSAFQDRCASRPKRALTLSRLFHNSAVAGTLT
jgi:hypothetical protein